MYNKLYISKVDEVYAHIKCENSDAMELNEYFTFYVPGYKFMPAFRNKVWDGKIRLFNSQSRQIYYGLIPYLEKFAKEREYTIEFDESVETYDEFSVAEAKDFIDTLGIPFEVRDYQIDAFIHAVQQKKLASITHSIRQVAYHISHCKIFKLQDSYHCSHYLTCRTVV